MIQITRYDAIEAIKGMFETNTFKADNISLFVDGANDTAVFKLDKRKYPRDEVVGKLVDYFKGKVIKDGECRIESITFVYTTVKVMEKKGE